MINRILNDIRRFSIAILAVFALYISMHTVFDAFCPSVILAGLPCPGCGITRSVLFLFTGQWKRSFYVQPMGVVLVLFALYCIFFRYIKGKKVPGFKGIVICLVIVSVILYIVRMVLYFPDRPPYTYNQGNLMEKLLPRYKYLWM